MEITIKSITYEEARLEYFKGQKAKAEQCMKYWAKKAARDPRYLTQAHDKACEAADRVMFYADVIKMFEVEE